MESNHENELPTTENVLHPTKKLFPIISLGFFMLLLGLLGGFFLGRILLYSSSRINNQHATNTPTVPPEELLYKSDWGTISWKNINYTKHTADFYFSYTDLHGSHSQLFMPHVSLENIPLNVMHSGSRFIFGLSGPGDGIAYFVAHDRPPFDVTQLKLPSNFTQQTYATVIGWLDDKTVLYKKFIGFDPKNQTVTYWSAPVDSIGKAKQVFLK